MRTGFIIAMIILLAVFIFTTKKQVATPTYTNYDSIQNAKIDSVRGEYQQVIDSLAKIKPKIVDRVKWLRQTDTVIYQGSDSSCIEIIERKNRLIAGQDTLIEALDLEARTYSDMVLVADAKLNLEQKRYENIIHCKDSVYKSLKDSLLTEIKIKKRSLFWQKVKTGFAVIAGTTAVIYSTVK